MALSSRALPIVVLGILGAVCASSSWACKPYWTSIGEFNRNKSADQVAFIGSVVSVSKRSPEREVAFAGTNLDITLRAKRWVRGKTQELVVVRGTLGSGRGTDCEGILDFSPAVGEEWLILGYRDGDAVSPVKNLSHKVAAGEEPELLKQLK
jgi:hypothetical protein